MTKGIPGIPIALIAAGGVSVYGGLMNVSYAGILQSILAGKAPTPGPAVQYATVPSGGGGSAAAPGTTDSAIANDALKYVGHPYSYGGYEADPAGWDCSSFCNWVIGHDLGMAIPGIGPGGYDGKSHGPPTGAWLLWNGCTGVSGGANAAQPGDLCVWQTHMGIATGGGNMVSALGAKWGTVVTTIPGGAPTGEILFVRRLVTVSTTSTAPASGGIFPTPTGKAPANLLPGRVG